MSKSLWLVSNSTILLGSSVGYLVLSFLIWEKLNGFSNIVWFNLFVFVGICGASLLLSLIGRFIPLKLILAGGIGLQMLTYYLVWSGSLDVTVIAIIYAAGLGLQFSAMPEVGAAVYRQGDTSKSRARSELIRNLVSITSPLIVWGVNSSIGYQQSMIIWILVLAVALLCLLPVHIEVEKVSAAGISLLAKYFQDKQSRSALHSMFAVGIAAMFGWGLLNVIMLDTLGDISNWSIVSVGIAVVMILVVQFLGKFDFTKERSKVKVFSFFPLLGIAIAAAILLGVGGIISFVVFMLAYRMFTTVTEVTTLSFNTYQLKQSESMVKLNAVEVNALLNTIQYLGMLILALVILQIPPEYMQSQWLLLVLAATTLFPLIL